MEERVTLSHSEWLIMQEIWRRGTASFREVKPYGQSCRWRLAAFVDWAFALFYKLVTS